MGFFNSLRNLKKWFTDRTGITEPREPIKRKHVECEIISNKKARMDDSLVEVVEISDESLSEAEEVEIIEPGPSTVPLRASPPVMLIDGRHYQGRNTSPSRTIDLTGNSDDETNRPNIIRSYSLSSNQYNMPNSMVRSASSKSSLDDRYSSLNSIKESRKSSLSMEGGFSALKISNTTQTNNGVENTLSKILMHYILPKSETTEISTTSSRSPLSLRRESFLNQSNMSHTSDKENLDIPELSLHKNKIIKKEMFFERILRKFKESQPVITSTTTTTTKKKTPDEIFIERCESMKKEMEIIISKIKIDVFPGYSEEIVDDIAHQLRGQQNELIFKGKNIRKADLRTVYSPEAWLNDEVINHYLSMIIDRNPNNLHSFDTFFYTKLSSQGYECVRRWSRKKDIFACKKMFCPIHLGNHWCLICVNFIEKNVTYYDSLGGSNPKCLNIIFNYLKDEHKNKKNEELDISGWKLINASDCPKQRNSYDCGVFTCINAEYLARDAKLDFTQDDMPKLRHRICYEILNNKLCY